MENSFGKKEAIDLLLSKSATDVHSEKLSRDFLNYLSQRELKFECYEYRKS